MTPLVQLEKQIARLERRAKFLNEISSKYWIARRIIFVAGALLALAFCNFAGSTAAWLVAGLLVIVFSVVTVFHTRVRDSLTRNSLLIEIKQVQIARIQLDWERIPPGDPSAHPSRAIRSKLISISPENDRCIDYSTALSPKKAARD